MRHSWLPAALALVAGTVLRAAAEEPRFRYFKSVNAASAADDEILAVTFDSDIYAGTRDGFADLRVVDSHGKDVPYKLERAVERRTEKVRLPCASRVVSLKENENNSIEIVVALAEKEKDQEKIPSASGLAIRTPVKDFERRVQVFGSADGRDWQALVTDAVIFDYSRYMDVANRDIALPENAFRQYRLVIEEVTDEQRSNLTELTRHIRDGTEQERTERTMLRNRPLRIDRIELWHTVPREQDRQDVLQAYPVAGFDSEEDAKHKQSIVHVRSRREPLTSLSIEPDTANFSRRAVVQVPVRNGVATQWREVGRGAISSVRFRDFQKQALKLEFPEQRVDEYRIVIDNEDSPPLAIKNITAHGNVYRATFIAGKDGPYRVYYGSETATAPKYDTATLFAVLGDRYEPAAATLGPQSDNPGYDRGADFRFLENRAVLAAAIALLVVVLTVVLLRAGRRIEKIPPEQP